MRLLAALLSFTLAALATWAVLEVPMFVPSHECAVLELPEELAAVAGARRVLAHEHDLFDVYAAFEEALGGYEAGARLRCFTVEQETAVFDLFRATRRLRVTDDAATVRDADSRHAARSWGRDVRHSRNPVGTRAWSRARTQ